MNRNLCLMIIFETVLENSNTLTRDTNLCFLVDLHVANLARTGTPIE